MENRDSINRFFASIDFKLIESDTSEYFGYFYDTYLFENSNIYFRLVGDRSILSIDVSNDNLNWYDLVLIKALIYDEKKLNIVTTIEEQSDFLQTEFINIATLFNNKNYPITTKKLEELRDERVKQMFLNQ